MGAFQDRGAGVYFRIMAALPGTTSELAVALDMQRDNVLDILRRLHGHKLLRIEGWRPPMTGGNTCEVWGIGPGPDAPIPAGRRLRPRAPCSFRTGTFNFVLLWRALEDGHTVRSLWELLGLHRVAIYAWLGDAKKLGLVHISGWEQQPQGPAVRIYKLGNKRDATYPKPAGKVEANRRHWRKRTDRLKQEAMIRATTRPAAQSALAP